MLLTVIMSIVEITDHGRSEHDGQRARGVNLGAIWENLARRRVLKLFSLKSCEHVPLVGDPDKDVFRC